MSAQSVGVNAPGHFQKRPIFREKRPEGGDLAGLTPCPELGMPPSLLAVALDGYVFRVQRSGFRV